MKQFPGFSRRSLFRAISLCTAAAGLAALAGCGSASAPGSSAAASSDIEPTAEITPFLSAEEYPVVDGSTACMPLMAAMMHAATGIPLEEAQSGLSVSTTGFAWERMGVYDDEDCQLLIVYEAPEYIQQEIAEHGTQLEITPIGRDALVFIANEANPVASLNQQQLLDIYSGKIKNWSEVGGSEADIVPFQRSKDSGSQTLFKKLLIKDNPLMDPPTELAPADMGGLVDDVAAYNNTGNALGYSVYYYIDQMYSQPGLKLLGVDGIMPTQETIADNSYPLCNEFYAVLPAGAAPDSPERKLYDWICSKEGAELIRSAGYVAVNS